MQRKSRSLQVVELRSSCNHESAKHLAEFMKYCNAKGMSIACVQKTVVENSFYCSVNCAVPPLIDLQQAVKPLWGPIPLLPATWRIALQQRNAHGNYSGTTTLTAAVFESRHRLKNRRSHFCQSVVPLLSHSDISAEGWQKNADSEQLQSRSSSISKRILNMFLRNGNE